MKHNEYSEERRGMNPFKNYRFGFTHIEAEDEFATCASREPEVRPTLSRWFCGMHDLEETFICRAL